MVATCCLQTCRVYSSGRGPKMYCLPHFSPTTCAHCGLLWGSPLPLSSGRLVIKASWTWSSGSLGTWPSHRIEVAHERGLLGFVLKLICFVKKSRRSPYRCWQLICDTEKAYRKESSKLDCESCSLYVSISSEYRFRDYKLYKEFFISVSSHFFWNDE